VIAISLLPELVSGALARARRPVLLRSDMVTRPMPASALAGRAS